jgi:ABC-type branched-subunit amino acid transport system ATPase component
VLQARDIRKTFGTLVALEGADVTVGRGEIVGLIGPNGSGKSTLLHVISGRTPATSGTVLLGGRDVTRAKPATRIRAGLSIKFQLARVYLDQTVADNLLLAVQAAAPLLSLMLSRTRAREAGAITRLLDEFHLTHARDQLARELSHGEQQWLEIAMAMAVRPTILLLDEPTAGMSREERLATGERIRAARDRCGILIVEHDLDFIRGLCDRISVLHQGRIIADGMPAQIEADPRVQEVYLTRV